MGAVENFHFRDPRLF